MPYGITSEGWVGKPLSTIDDEVDADLRGILGDSAGTDADGKIPLASIAGQLKSLVVDPIAELWDLGEAIYSSINANSASDASLDTVCSLTGTLRNDERFSTVVCVCVGTPLTFLAAGRVATVEDTGARFLSQEDATITLLSSWAATTAYALDDKVTNSSRVYVCITAGTSAGSGGPTTTSADITDGTVHWKYLGEGTGAVDVDFEAEESGEIGALAGDLNTIATPVSGWNAVVNLDDAEEGAPRETDAALRVRREAELAAAGNTTVDTIRANVLRVNEGSTDPNHEPPVACKVFFNDTDITDSDGVPPHSVEVLVQDGTTADIAQAIWDSVGAGTRTYGTRSDTVVDSEGNNQTVYWSRPVEVPIYVTATAYYDAAEWAGGTDADVVQAVLSALLTFAATYPIGQDVRTSPLIAAILRGPSETDDDGDAVVPAAAGSSAVPGLLEVDPIYIGTSPGPASGTQITITGRQIATFDSSRCVITASSETP